MIHQGSAGARGTPSDIQIAALEIVEMRQRMAEIIARHSGRPSRRCSTTSTATASCRPQEAVEYGLVDGILEPRKLGGGIASEVWQ